MNRSCTTVLITRAIVLLSACLLSNSTGCAGRSDSGVRMWVTEICETPVFNGDSPFADHDSNDRAIHIQGAINEVVSLALELTGDGAVDLHLSDLTSESGRSLSGCAAVFRMHPVQVRNYPEWHVRNIHPQQRVPFVYDALVPSDAPAGGLPAILKHNESVKVWIDIRIPKGTIPEEYRANIDVLLDGRNMASADIVLTVWPFVLPDRANLEMLVELDPPALFYHHVHEQGVRFKPSQVIGKDPMADVLRGVLASSMRLLHDHRMSPQVPALRPIAKVGEAGHLTVDWSEYDRTLSNFIDGSAYSDRIAPLSWLVPFDQDFPPPPAYDPLSSPTYSRITAEYLGSVAQHFFANDWLSRAIVRLPYAGSPGKRASEAAGHFAYITRRADERLRIVSDLFPQDMAKRGWYRYEALDLSGYVDIWSPLAQFFSENDIRETGATPWMRVDRPPYSGTVEIPGRPVDARVIAWQAKLAGLHAIELSMANNWSLDAGAQGLPQECIDYDPGCFLYPGRPFGLLEPVASVRLKRLRRGMQDLAYLELLESRKRGFIAATITDSLVSNVGSAVYETSFLDAQLPPWNANDSAWEHARQLMADQLLTTLDGDPNDPAQQLPASLRWRNFIDETRDVSCDVIGVRVNPTVGLLGGTIGVDVLTRIHNRKRLPIVGHLGFGPLPVGWSTDSTEGVAVQVEPGESRPVTLSAKASGLTWDENGVRRIPLRLSLDDDQPILCEARLCHITPQQLSDPILVDGVLDDWPTGVGNHASDFRLICGSVPGENLAHKDHSRNATHFFAAVDEDTLLFAVKCDTDLRESDVVSNVVPGISPDGIPYAGEMVEILLDPANTGTRIPSDLYRIVVGPAGATWEKGITTYPPVGPTERWPAAIRHACKWQQGAWTAEIEVPLDAFPESTGHARVWGLNVTRYDLCNQEYATWSATLGNAFNPETMGNITVP